MGDSEGLGLFCPVCALEFGSVYEFEEHKKTPEHLLNWLNRQYRKQRLTYLSDKGGISLDVIRDSVNILHSQNTYTVEVITGNGGESTKSSRDIKDLEPLEFTLRIFNGGQKEVFLIGILVLNAHNLRDGNILLKLTDKMGIASKNKRLVIRQGQAYDVNCCVKSGPIARPRHIPVLFELYFADDLDENGQIAPFYVGRTIEIKGAAYTLREFGHYVGGILPAANVENELKLERPLKGYKIPAWFMTLAFNNIPRNIRKRMNIRPEVSFDNYTDFFKTLLWLEELQEELDIQFYSKKQVTLSFPTEANVRGVKCVVLREEGLAENRPSVMVRDQVFVCLSKDRETKESPQWFQGFVHKVELVEIYIGFDEKFMRQFNETCLFDVEFIINRFPMMVSHRAVELCKFEKLKNFIFPQSVDRVPNVLLPNINPYDQNIRKNEEQIQAIKHIVAGSSRNAPYVVFGPPGTGKTVTVVEAIKQVLYHDESSHVLACAPSNTATDVIAERLLEHFDHRHVLRLYADSRAKYLTTLPPKLREASNYRENSKSVYFPSRETMMTKRVLVTTFVTAAKISGAVFPLGHFTHVVLDEVGHAMECEALIPVGGVISSSSHLILAGDPHQLGPVVRNLNVLSGSGLFPETGLDTSFLERIMKMPLYQKSQTTGTYNPRYVTKLVKNYRSHPTILKVPNDLFYNSELKANGNPEVINYFSQWSHLPRKDFLVLFHAVDGEDKLEQYSPSYHNPQEVKKVVTYLEYLLNGQPRIEPEQIGIITPYRLQVDKLKQKISRQYSGIVNRLKIGSVEDFQGEERRVIIISTVRASRKHLAKDDLFRLGFLRNPKRFNVAVTRAQCLLIVVGCPKVLILDRYWKSLINHAQENEGYIGSRAADPKENLDDLIKAMENMDIRPIVGDISSRQLFEVPKMRKF